MLILLLFININKLAAKVYFLFLRPAKIGYSKITEKENT